MCSCARKDCIFHLLLLIYPLASSFILSASSHHLAQHDLDLPHLALNWFAGIPRSVSTSNIVWLLLNYHRVRVEYLHNKVVCADHRDDYAMIELQEGTLVAMVNISSGVFRAVVSASKDGHVTQAWDDGQWHGVTLSLQARQVRHIVHIIHILLIPLV